jgi:tritrans,polycis-undecaprenyl-diphosphate synthase [geranylgeranyl-diphosphate specific]
MNNLLIPNHIAVILDGNRRWASKRGLDPWDGHKQGIENFSKFLEWCLDLGITQVSAYVLSTENIRNRSKREVIEILKLLKDYAEKWEKEKTNLFDKYEVKVRFLGDFKQLPSELVKILKRIMKKTEKYHKRFINILIAYGGRYELTQTVKKIVKLALKTRRIQITEKTIQDNLLVTTDVELVIRTGGMPRLSNFLPWQSTYAELFITDTLWPDFNKEELTKAIKWFSNIKRNFGK